MEFEEISETVTIFSLLCFPGPPLLRPIAPRYDTTAEILETDIDAICHVAAHPFDCIGAKASGMRAVYVNRRQRPFGCSPHQPDLEVRDFTDLADRLAA